VCAHVCVFVCVWWEAGRAVLHQRFQHTATYCNLPKNGEIALLPSTNELIVVILVLAGSTSSFTEINNNELMIRV